MAYQKGIKIPNPDEIPHAILSNCFVIPTSSLSYALYLIVLLAESNKSHA